MPTTLTTGDNYIVAGTTAIIQFQLYDTESDTLDDDAIEAVTLTVLDENRSVINRRNAADVLNTDGGTLAVNGTFTLELSELDNAFIGTNAYTEVHIVEVTWTWTTGSDTRIGGEIWSLTVERAGA